MLLRTSNLTPMIIMGKHDLRVEYRLPNNDSWSKEVVLMGNKAQKITRNVSMLWIQQWRLKDQKMPVGQPYLCYYYTVSNISTRLTNILILIVLWVFLCVSSDYLLLRILYKKYQRFWSKLVT